MQLLSVNVAPLGPMSVQGEEIRTGFDKRPACGRVVIEPMGLAGDARGACAADPNRAVFLYQAAHYAAWREELGRPLDHGLFGENLTFDGLDDAEFCIGDELSVGEARLRITQPRFPCRKMTVRMNAGDDFPLRYLRSGRLGFFCSVLEPSAVGAGDAIRLERRAESGAASLTEFARVTYLEPQDQQGLERLLASPELIPEWRIKVERLLRRARGGEDGWRAYRPLTVRRKSALSPDVVALDLEGPEGDPLPDFDAGQFLTVMLETPGATTPAIRSYSIVSRTPGGGYQLAVKREPAPADRPTLPAGIASNHLHDRVAAGAALAAMAPRGQFVVEPGSRPIVLLSAGIGVTPLLAMLEQLARCPLGRPVFFLHVARNGAEHVYGDRVRELVSGNAKLQSRVFFTRPGPEDAIGRDFDAAGRPTAETLEKLLPSLNADFYLCGPEAFMRDTARGLAARGVPTDQIRYEHFGAGGSLFEDEQPLDALPEALDAEGRPITVTFARSGVTAPWREGVFSLLSLAEKHGLRPEASCRTGLCGLCLCRVEGGTFDYAVEPLERPKPGEAMICCARPTSSVVLDL